MQSQDLNPGPEPCARKHYNLCPSFKHPHLSSEVPTDHPPKDTFPSCFWTLALGFLSLKRQSKKKWQRRVAKGSRSLVPSMPFPCSNLLQRSSKHSVTPSPPQHFTVKKFKYTEKLKHWHDGHLCVYLIIQILQLSLRLLCFITSTHLCIHLFIYLIHFIFLVHFKVSCRH